MSYSSNEMATDFKTLLQVAQVHLPDVAHIYADCAKALVKEDGESGFHPTYEVAWSELRYEFLRLLTRSQANVQDTAVALTHVVNAYVKADDDAAEQLKGLIEENEEGGVDDSLEGPDKSGKYPPPTVQKPVDISDENPDPSA